MPQIDRFNIRVYGIVIQDQRLLVSDEILQGKYCTKLPGGGLEFGEGTLDCLKREFREELNVEIEQPELFYLSDFFQKSSFREADQVICIYYTCQLTSTNNLNISTIKFDFQYFKEREERQRWIPLSSLNPEEFTFPIDRIAIKKLIESL